MNSDLTGEILKQAIELGLICVGGLQDITIGNNSYKICYSQEEEDVDGFFVYIYAVYPNSSEKLLVFRDAIIYTHQKFIKESFYNKLNGWLILNQWVRDWGLLFKENSPWAKYFEDYLIKLEKETEEKRPSFVAQKALKEALLKAEEQEKIQRFALAFEKKEKAFYIVQKQYIKTHLSENDVDYKYYMSYYENSSLITIEVSVDVYTKFSIGYAITEKQLKE